MQRASRHCPARRPCMSTPTRCSCMRAAAAAADTNAAPRPLHLGRRARDGGALRAPRGGGRMGAVVGAQVAFFGNRGFTFAHQGAVAPAWVKFQGTALAGALFGMAVVAAGV